MSDPFPRTVWEERIWKRFYSFGRSLRWQIEHELIEGYYAPWGDGSDSPAGIVGSWRPMRRRLSWFHVPLTPWREI